MMPIRSIHQIEITSRCNLRCRYCTHRSMSRAKMDMDEATFTRALEVAKQLGGENELNLAGIGESTMHPDFVKFVYMARKMMGDSVELVLATNGLLMTKELALSLVDARMRIFVSIHRPERAKLAIDILNELGMLSGVSADPSVASTNWAGQVDWKVTAQNVGAPCPWIRNGKAMVLSDGKVTRCSFDSTAEDVLGTIWDDVATMQTSPYALCKNCHLVP